MIEPFYMYGNGADGLLGLPIVIYLFLGGAGAGACLVLSCLSFAGPAALGVRGFHAQHERGSHAFDVFRGPLDSDRSFRTFIGSGYVASAGFLFVGICSLLVDLGRTDRLSFLVTHPSLSYISIGAYSLAFCLLLAVFLAALWFLAFPTLPRVVLAIVRMVAIAVSFVVMVYTGLLLASIASVPFWNSWCVPLLFALSAASCGIALIVLTTCCVGLLGRFDGLLRALIAFDFLIIILEAGATVVLMAVSLNGADPWSLASADLLGRYAGTARMDLSALAAADLVGGDLAQWFWGGYVALGLVVPIVLGELARGSTRAWQEMMLLFSMSVLFGGFIMRSCIVFAGTQVGSMI